MNPLEALSTPKPKDEPADTAPAAAAWLRNPAAVKTRLTYAQLLMKDLEENGEWTGPDYDPEEDTAQ